MKTSINTEGTYGDSYLPITTFNLDFSRVLTPFHKDLAPFLKFVVVVVMVERRTFTRHRPTIPSLCLSRYKAFCNWNPNRLSIATHCLPHLSKYRSSTDLTVVKRRRLCSASARMRSFSSVERFDFSFPILLISLLVSP